MTRPLRIALWLGLVAAGAASTARAQDACLAGVSILADQRAIAALRADLDAACPCDEVATRGAFRRCGKTVVAGAVTAGDLRAECQRTASRIVKGGACGSTRIPCGRRKPTASVPIGCKVKRDTSCVDKPRVEQNACDALDYCADVVDWTAGTCSDVRARGPFGAGVRQITFTKQSAVDPLAPRPLDTYVWYPTAAGAAPVDPSTNAVVDAPFDASGGPYPIVLFSHGSCGYPLQSIFLMPLLAARGYVVVAPPHPPNTFFDGLAVCGAPSTLVQAAIERPQDMMFVLDEMIAENDDPASPFFGALDPTRVAMTGHSFGGFTTYLVASADPRIDVAVPMAPAVPNSQAGLTIPSLTILGAIDSVVNNQRPRDVFAVSDPPRYLVEIRNAGHYAFSNLCFPSPDCSPPATLTQAEAHGNVLRWVIPFLEWKLRGDESFAAFFEAPEPPGVVVQRAE
jgi:dienelactone hydrolase